MAVQYIQGKVNVVADEKTSLLSPKPRPKRLRRTKSEFFEACNEDDPPDYVVFLAASIILLFLPLGLLAVAVALQAYNDNKAKNYEEVKRKRRLVYVIGLLAILIDCLIVAAIVILVALLTQ